MKVGDTVRCVRWYPALVEKTSYVISAVSPYYVGVDNELCADHDASRFELIPTAAPMTLDQYQQEAMRSAAMGLTQQMLLLKNALGLAGEGGEVADHVKKHVFHGHPLDKDHIKKELGDILWYIAAKADSLGMTLEDVATANVEKLRKRYPNGFSVEESLNRSE